MIGVAGALTQFLRLTFLRPVERFLAQVISVSTSPTAFVREHIHLGDTTNFLRAAGFFVARIFMAAADSFGLIISNADQVRHGGVCESTLDALEIYCRDAEEDDGSMMLTTFGDSPWSDGMPKIPECVRRDRQ